MFGLCTAIISEIFYGLFFLVYGLCIDSYRLPLKSGNFIFLTYYIIFEKTLSCMSLKLNIDNVGTQLLNKASGPLILVDF